MKNLVIFFFFFLVVVCPRICRVTAQNDTGNNNRELYATRFSPSMAAIIGILAAALFFMAFFTIYIRRRSGSAGAGGGSIRREGRRAAAARGLDASVVESFPTFTYAEVKDHKIGKGALECAVCLSEFEDEETLRLLPKCDHVFHPECVGAWLASHVTCPVCRADLVPQPAVDEGSVANEGVAIQIEDDDVDRNSAPPQRAQRQGSFSRMFSFGRFRSHSTGHDSVVRPGEDVDRFTLRLPAEVRKEVITRASLNRTRSCAAETAAAAAALPREGSSRRGYRAAGFAGRMDALERAAKSDRWAFFARAFSMRSPRGARESGGGEGSRSGGGVGRTAAKLPSFKCLEPSVHDNGDEVKLTSGEPDRSNPV